MRAILTTAVEQPAERPVLTVAQVFDLADRMPGRFRALVLLAAFASLRRGEVSALRRWDIAADAGWVRVTRAFVESTGQGLVVGPPKSRAGVRTLALPYAVRPDVLKHLDTYAKDGEDALVFTGKNGGAVRRPNRSDSRVTGQRQHGGNGRRPRDACPTG